jgi:hypothetical protein
MCYVLCVIAVITIFNVALILHAAMISPVPNKPEKHPEFIF